MVAFLTAGQIWEWPPPTDTLTDQRLLNEEPAKSAFVKATIATAAEAAHAQNYMKHWRIGFFF